MAHTYVKKLDTVSAGLFDLRDYKKLPISPVMFAAAVTTAREPAQNMNLTPISGCPELVKFEFKISDEEAARRNPFMSSLIDGADTSSREHKKKLSVRERLEPKQIADRRAIMLRKCFPVTLHRIQVTPSLLSLKNTLTSRGIRDWQVDQAICNLQIHELCHKYVLSEMDREDADAPLAVLASRFEDVLAPMGRVNLFQVEEQLIGCRSGDRSHLLR
jgi:hypothetical protein